MGGISLNPYEIEIISLICKHGLRNEYENFRLSFLSRKIDWLGFVENAPQSFLFMIERWSRHDKNIPVMVKRRMKEDIINLTRKNMLIKACLEEVAAAFRKEKVDFILLKGFFLESRIYYGKPRFFDDLDILINEDDLGRAQDALLKSGYKMLTMTDDEKSRITQQELFIKPSSKLLVELHTSIQVSYAPFNISNSSLFRRSKSVSIDGIRVRVLDDEMALIHLCIHHVYSHSLSTSKMVQYSYEISEFIKRLDKSRAEWNAFARLVHSAKAGAAVYESLAYANKLFPVAMDHDALSMIKNGASKKEMLVFKIFLRLMSTGPFHYKNGIYWLMKLLLCNSNKKRADIIKDAYYSARDRCRNVRCRVWPSRVS